MTQLHWSGKSRDSCPTSSGFKLLVSQMYNFKIDVTYEIVALIKFSYFLNFEVLF